MPLHMGQINPIASEKPYDLAVCYRVYPGLSGKPALGFTDKLSMVKANFKSFRAAIGSLRVKIWIILDSCPPVYQELAEQIFAGLELEFILLQKAGNQATFLRQCEVLSSQKLADLVYFIEDDYLHLPHALEIAVAFMRRHPTADFITLYDHPDYYTKYIHLIKGSKSEEKERRWRTVTSTCLTFMARWNSLSVSAKLFATYANKNSDLGLWMAITKTCVCNPVTFVRSVGDGLFFVASAFMAWRFGWQTILFQKKRTLWAPSPSLATHLESDGLDLKIDWSNLLRQQPSKSVDFAN